MDAFLSFHAPGFWGVLALLTGMVVFGLRPLVSRPARAVLLYAYWVLLPFGALVLGGVSPRLMGLFYIDWETSLRLGSASLLVGAALAATARLFWGPAVERAAPDPLRFGVSLAAVVGTVGAEEFFWVFLRGLLTELLLRQGVEASAYWALWLAALLLLPAVWLVQPAAPRRVVKTVVLVVSTVLFLYTHNFWLGWGMHALLWLWLGEAASSWPVRRR